MESHKGIARIAGFLYLCVAVCSGFAAFVRSTLIVSGAAAATVNNINTSQMLFRIGIASDLVGQTFHVALVLTLYELFRTVSKTGALLMVVIALVPVPIACLNTLNEFAVLALLNGADYLKTASPDQLHSRVMFFLDMHNHGILVAQVFWGLWLLPLAYLIFKSVYVPRLLGFFLLIAGLGYLVDSFARFLITTYDANIAMFTFIGEVLFLFWLLVKGVNDQKPASVEAG